MSDRACVKASRRAIVLDRTGYAIAELEALHLSGWIFQRVATMDAARKALSCDPPPIGLVAFDSERPWSLGELESVLRRPDIEWIALLGPDLLNSDRLGPELLRSFHDFHSRPLDRERLSCTLGHAHGKVELCRHALAPRRECGAYGMTGTSSGMRQLYRQIDKILTVDAPVLIGGESGTGKELVAHAIHQYSVRARGPFIAMNCGAIAPSLIQSELFGHERGAFTGAAQRKIGNIEAANGGILFLDEIGDLPLEMQANLLRFLQEKCITRVGSTERVKVDVRVIAATHVDLVRAVTQGRFREDLYYRLNVLHLGLPALRERREDIPLLAECIFAEHREQAAPQVRGFSSAALQAMMRYDWPGNVRELVNRVQRAMIMTESRLIGAADLGLSSEPEQGMPTLDEIRTRVERELIETSLKTHGNNVSETARRLGISRVTLYRMIDRLKIVL
ncbi:sigma-54 dependent transcriptional regulator [Thauera sp. SDU_THAU2]|uniref:sigma-54 dependent transcriptional regulator n=1 Tax=Thauera sp. SDU_THAU2 TaxID=3136633 RepID=UPI0031201F7C